MPVDANYSALTQEINWNLKAFKLKVGYRVRITNYNNVFSIGFTKNWLKENFLLILSWKLILGSIGIKDSSWEKIIGSFYEKELLLSKLWMSYYPEPDSNIRGKVKVILHLSN